MYCLTQGIAQHAIHEDFKYYASVFEGELTSIGILTLDMLSDDTMLSQVGDENVIAPLL
jgi:hypothetical protein